MSETLKFGNGQFAVKEGSALAYNSENGNFKPLPFTFDRSTSATRVNKEGLIEVVSNNEPRIDFLNDSKGALLLEPQSTNSIIQSENFSNVVWGKSGVTITSNSIISPDGTVNADLLTADGTSIQHAVLQSNTSSSKTMSIFAKAGTQQFIQILTSGTSAPVANYDLINGTANLVGSSSTASIENYGNGWYRCILSTTDAAAGAFYICYSQSLVSGRFPFFASSNTVYLWGAQSEINASYPTSYIPTQGSIGTRVAESCSGAGNDQVFNDSEGVIYVETQPFIDGDFTSVYISLSDNTTGTNFITIQHRDSGQLRVYAGNFSTIIFLQDIDMSENLKIALQYENITDFKLYVNGISYPIYSTPTNSAFVGLNTFDFKLRGSASGYWLGQVKEAKYFNTALTDQELISLTS